MRLLALLLILLSMDEPANQGAQQKSPPLPKAPVPAPPVPSGRDPAATKPGRQVEPEPAVKNLFLTQHDRDRDGRLTTVELPEELRKFHARADRNGDGYLDADEIMRARNPIGQRARRLENLKLGLQGRLRPRGSGGLNLGAVAGEWLHRIDANGDGFVDDLEMRAALEQPELLLNGLVPRSPEGRLAVPIPGANGSRAGAEKAPAPNPSGLPKAPIPIERGRGVDQPPPPPTADEPDELKDEHTPDGLPTVNTILKHLDKNQNDAVDRSEAIDQLRDHFNFLDKNKDGKLDRGELERSLKLARMFGGKSRATPAQKAARRS